MALSIVPYISLLCFGTQYGFPAYATITAMLKGDTVKEEFISQWTVFWIICVLVSVLENSILFLITDYIPLYLEMKTLFFFWLGGSDYWGAAWLWYKHLKGLHLKYDTEYYDKVMKALRVEKVSAGESGDNKKGD
mmetsp:Transcript_62895/g.149926  ORF Transcript_62895/g.149926 Transcript_62895/m.149926 type:complete len:135 (+) Transcript_62895:71-475(+)